MKNNKKRKYYSISSQKRDRLGLYDLTSLKKGVLMSVSANNKTLTAYREVIRILTQDLQENEFEDNYDVDGDNIDLEERIKMESKKLSEEKQRFKFIDNISRCLVLIQFNNPNDIPSILIEKLMSETYSNSVYKNVGSNYLLSRFINRLIPLDIICPAKIGEIKNNLENLIKSHLKSSSLTDSDDKTVDNLTSWACFYSSRCSNSEIKRQEVYDLITEIIWGTSDSSQYLEMKTRYPVNLENPKKAIIVEIIRSFCGISIINDYRKYNKYNLHTLANRSNSSCELKINSELDRDLSGS